MIQPLKLFLQRYSHVNWTVADQVMVSGTNFLTGILLARFLGVESYGQFVVLYAVLLYVNTIQFALIIAPMISIAPQISSKKERTQYFQGVITLQVLFSVVLSLLIFSLGSRFQQWYSLGNIQENILPLAASILLFQLQDWLRRYYFICSKGKTVFINDFISYGGQIGLLFLFYAIGKLNIANAFWAIALSSAIAFLIGILTENLRPAVSYALPALKQSWRFGRDLLFSGQIYWAGSQGILIFSATMLGATAAGGIKAALNIVGLLNLLFQGMENIIPIQAAQKYSQNQITGLMDYLKKISLLGGLLLTVPCLAIALLSKELMLFIYGKEYVVFASLIIWQVGIAFIAFFRMQVFYFFRTIGYTKEIVFNTIVSTTLTFIIAGTFIYTLQETGIMMALLFGEVAGLVYGAWLVNKYFHGLKSYTISPK
ncbi:MAG: hypothetical protein IGS49_04855 [Chlorogloeopsis fritschii C42_A2020_084]|uniref:lipopolysaccharide biosynthesis protein n=1 Tax=Chlorogloeopsis fritschii TaxID=1124 RepID=UPI001A0F7147|nr:hypothetical protein [Chlorogloeopsis fritschii]MBF2004795.1 hypothetical protein [Chlorogloeopsis fritschii C42_A2020_084]